MKLVISFEFPPIPDRRYDYCVYVDGEEERRHYGYGDAPAAAIRDFLENYEEDLMRKEDSHGPRNDER